MAQGTLSPQPVFHGWDDNGDPLPGGLLYTYEAGTTTPLATYSEVTLTNANANPVVLDAAGRCVLYLAAVSYKFVLKSAAAVTIWTQDNIGSVPVTTVALDIAGTAGEDLTAGQSVYLSAGDGGLTAGRWYKTDADLTYASSQASLTGMMPADLATGISGSVRLEGRVTGLSALTAGTVYYVSATAGAVTATAPSNVRAVGQADSTTSLVLGRTKPTAVQRVHSVTATVGNVGAGEDILATYTIPAGTLSADGMGHEGVFWGVTTNNANVKTLRLRVIEGANNNLLMAFALTINESGEWRLEFTTLRSAAAAFGSAAITTVGPANGPTSRIGTFRLTAAVATWANAVEIRLSGEATTTGDLSVTGGVIKLVP